MLTAEQKALVKADILADGVLNAFVNNSDGNTAIAAIYNGTASPDWFVWHTSVPVQDIQNAIVYANMTPAAAPDTTQLWMNKAMHAQGKQFNLQNLLLGRESIDASKSGNRAAFQDCLTALPTKADGTNQAAGWTAVQLAMSRKATRFEKLLSAGTGTQATPATMGFEGSVHYSDIEAARNS